MVPDLYDLSSQSIISIINVWATWGELCGWIYKLKQRKQFCATFYFMTLNSCSNNFVKIKPLDLVHIVILPGKSDKIDALFQAIIALLFQFTS